MSTWLVVAVWVLALASLGLLNHYEVHVWRALRRSPTPKEVDDLLYALGVWADKYSASGARKGSMNTKARDVELIESCKNVGLMWIRPRNEPPKRFGRRP